jgi:hypothetical protein
MEELLSKIPTEKIISQVDVNARDSRHLNSLALDISTRVRVSECTV